MRKHNTSYAGVVVRYFLIGLLLIGTTIFSYVPKASAAGNWTFSNRTATTPLSGKNYYPVAMSEDGQYMYSVAHAEGFFRSTDYGQTWSEILPKPSGDFWSLATSKSGQYVYAASVWGDYNNGYIWRSNDYGLTWAKITSDATNDINWSSLDTSADAQNVISGTQDGNGVWISKDGGATFTQTSLPTTGQEYDGVSVSADGNFMTAVQVYGSFYVSSDAGTTWTATTLPGDGGRLESGASDTGQYLVVPSATGSLWVSSDYGATWTSIAAAGTRDWYDAKVSATGQYMVANEFPGDIWVSSDYGQTWVNQTAGTEFASQRYQYIEISDDGKYILSGTQNTEGFVGDLFVGINSTITKIKLASTNNVTAPNTGKGVNITEYIYGSIVVSLSLIVYGIFLLRKRTSINVSNHKNDATD